MIKASLERATRSLASGDIGLMLVCLNDLRNTANDDCLSACVATFDAARDAPVKAAFKTTVTGALKKVQDSLRRFRADSGRPLVDIVLSSNVTLGADLPKDPGVAVWFTRDGAHSCIPVDGYGQTPAANRQAIITCSRRVASSCLTVPWRWSARRLWDSRRCPCHRARRRGASCSASRRQNGTWRRCGRLLSAWQAQLIRTRVEPTRQWQISTPLSWRPKRHCHDPVRYVRRGPAIGGDAPDTWYRADLSAGRRARTVTARATRQTSARCLDPRNTTDPHHCATTQLDAPATCG